MLLTRGANRTPGHMFDRNTPRSRRLTPYTCKIGHEFEMRSSGDALRIIRAKALASCLGAYWKLKNGDHEFSNFKQLPPGKRDRCYD